MEEFGKLLGWIVVWFFAFAILNFVLKYFNKNYASKVFAGKEKYLKLYRKIMSYVVKYHKYFGIGAFLIVFFHVVLMWKYVKISLSGFVALILMGILVVSGIILQWNKKINKVKFKKFHFILSLLLLASIVVHLT